MAIGANDKLDKALVRKYQSLKVDNAIIQSSIVDPNKMLEAMNDVASIQRNMFALSQKLSNTCYAFNARAARYKKAANM
jgi:hypothetical protein